MMFRISCRDRRITARVLSGETCAQVGAAFGLSLGRTYQITRETVHRLYPERPVYALMTLRGLRREHGMVPLVDEDDWEAPERKLGGGSGLALRPEASSPRQGRASR